MGKGAGEGVGKVTTAEGEMVSRSPCPEHKWGVGQSLVGQSRDGASSLGPL